MVGNVRFEGDALDVIHDEVRGVVLVKVVGDARDVGLAHEFCQGAGLLLEALGAIGELLAAVLCQNGHGGALPGGDLAGHELLDGYLGIQLGIQGQVGDAETALAQHPAHDVAAVQHGPGPQGHGEFFFVFRQVEAAVGTGALCFGLFLKAVVAEIFPFSHIVPPHETSGR